MDITRVLLFHSNLPAVFWTYVVCHAVFIINRLLTLVLGNKTPFEMLTATPPTFLDFKVFGCLAYATTLVQNRTKLDSRARKCIFLGYKPGTKGYLLFDTSTQNVFINRHAVFYENIFPYFKLNDQSQSSPTCTIGNDSDDPLILFDPLPPKHMNPILDNSAAHTHHDNTNFEIEHSLSHVNDPPMDFEPRRSTRIKKTPGYFNDFHCSLSQSTNSVLYPMSAYLNYSNLSDSHRHYIFQMSVLDEPKTYKQAIQSKE